MVFVIENKKNMVETKRKNQRKWIRLGGQDLL